MEDTGSSDDEQQKGKRVPEGDKQDEGVEEQKGQGQEDQDSSLREDGNSTIPGGDYLKGSDLEREWPDAFKFKPLERVEPRDESERDTMNRSPIAMGDDRLPEYAESKLNWEREKLEHRQYVRNLDALGKSPMTEQDHKDAVERALRRTQSEGKGQGEGRSFDDRKMPRGKTR